MPILMTLLLFSIIHLTGIQGEQNSEKPRTPDPALSEPILNAAKRGELEEVKSLLARGADINARTGYNQTPLMLAAGKGHLDVVRLLIDSGADLNIVDTFYKSFTALIAAANGGHTEIVKLLLDKGAKGREQVIFSGIQEGNSAIVKIALSGATIPKPILDRGLDFAKNTGNEEIIAILTEAGATAAPPAPLKPEVKVDPETLKRFAGTYRISDERQYTFILRDGKLSGWDVRQYSFPLTAIGPNVFRIGDNDARTVTFNDENGRITGMTLTQSGATQTYQRVEAK